MFCIAGFLHEGSVNVMLTKSEIIPYRLFQNHHTQRVQSSQRYSGGHWNRRYREGVSRRFMMRAITITPASPHQIHRLDRHA